MIDDNTVWIDQSVGVYNYKKKQACILYDTFLEIKKMKRQLMFSLTRNPILESTKQVKKILIFKNIN